MADQDVALVRITVECSHIQYLMQVAVHYHAPDLAQVAAFCKQLFRVVDGAAVDIGHGKDTLSGQIINDGGAGDPFFIIDAFFLEQASILCLNSEIKFSFGDLL